MKEISSDVVWTLLTQKESHSRFL